MAPVRNDKMQPFWLLQVPNIPPSPILLLLCLSLLPPPSLSSLYPGCVLGLATAMLHCNFIHQRPPSPSTYIIDVGFNGQFQYNYIIMNITILLLCHPLFFTLPALMQSLQSSQSATTCSLPVSFYLHILSV